jgi:transcriptional regulator with XRE-family HTH domain
MRIPWWMTAIDPNDWGRLGTVIADFFSDLPMAQSELAKRLKVDQTAISRWAGGRTKPTLDEFSKAVDVVEDRIAGLTKRVTKSKALVEAMGKAHAAAAAGGTEGVQRGSVARSQVHQALKGFSVRKPGGRKGTKKSKRRR